MSTAAPQPRTVRELDTPAARELARLAEILGELQTVLLCCERLVGELAADEPDDLTVDALWTTAVLTYARCFGGDAGLSEDDVTATPLQGEVLEWHRVLIRLRERYTDTARAPREQCSVGVTQDESGHASGIAITSTPRPMLDDVTVKQTGALAYELSKLVDERMTQRQERVRASVGDMAVMELERLPRIDLAPAG